MKLFASMAAAVVLASAAPGAAQDTTIDVAHSDAFGRYITDGEGRALYLFTADTQGGEGAGPQIACAEDCLQNWPLLTVEGQPQAAEGLDENLLGTTQHEGRTVITWGGWPLYHFVQDTGAGQTTGQDIESYGGEWYLVTPEGEKAGH